MISFWNFPFCSIDFSFIEFHHCNKTVPFLFFLTCFSTFIPFGSLFFYVSFIQCIGWFVCEHPLEQKTIKKSHNNNNNDFYRCSYIQPVRHSLNSMQNLYVVCVNVCDNWIVMRHQSISVNENWQVHDIYMYI